MNYKFFKKNENKYIFFSLKNKISSIFCIILIIIAIILNLKYRNLGESDIVFRLMSFFVPLLWLYQSNTKIEIDRRNKTLSKHIFYGLIKKSYPLDKFVNFQVIRNTTNFIYDGTDLEMRFETNGKVNDVKIYKMRNTVKLNELKLEITKIINVCQH